MTRRMRTISASEIGAFVYCRRSWWYAYIEGENSANIRELQLGARAHEHHGARMAVAGALTWLGYIAIAVAIVLALVSLGGV
ncbi:MAG: hypothetical protein ACE5FI_06880 [Anaerolineales bacterium]